MTWSQGMDTANKYWRMLGTVVTVGVMVGGGLYAAGRDTEKFTAAQELMKEDVVSVKAGITKMEDEILPHLADTINKNSKSYDDLKKEVIHVTDKVKLDQEEIKSIKREVQDIKQQLVGMKTQQKADADWIKQALQRIESKQ